MMTYFVLFFAIVLISTGQLLQKKTTLHWHYCEINSWKMRFKTRYLWYAIFCLGLGTFFWLIVLQSVPLGVAYPILSLNFVIVVLASRFFFSERIRFQDLLGLLAIVIGVSLLASHLS